MSNLSVFEDLRAAIATGELAPQQSLVESDIMARFDAGRPAVRVALARLEQEGLVEQRPNHSARVRLVSGEEAVEIAEARALLERRAAAKAATRATPEGAAVLRGILNEITASRAGGDVARAVELDRAFHEEVIRLSGDATIARLHRGLHGHLVRFHLRMQVERAHADAHIEEHAAIVAAIEAGEAEAADAAMAAHLEHLTEAVRAVMTR